MHVRKQVRGQEFPGLDALQPQVLSNAEMAHMEFDARRSVEHPYGLGYERIPLPHPTWQCVLRGACHSLM